jgi:hypothetical protein
MLAERAAASNPVGLSAPADGLEEISKRAKDASDFMDKQIRQLIDIFQKHGARSNEGKFEMTFHKLFQITEDVFDALAGLLRTAKKYAVVGFQADMLLQGQNDRDILTLLKEKHDGVKIDRRKSNTLVISPDKGGFGKKTLAEQFLPCHVCKKTVYPMEFVGASEKSFHKSCFRCTTCKGQLKQSDYSVGPDGNFYCETHNREISLLFMKEGVNTNNRFSSNYGGGGNADAEMIDLEAEEAAAEAAEAAAEMAHCAALALQPGDIEVYQELWSEAGGDLGRVGQTELIEFFNSSKLDGSKLGKIWGLADTEAPKGALNKLEFYTAMKLIALSQWGLEPDLDILGAEAGAPNVGSRASLPPVLSPAAIAVRSTDYDSEEDDEDEDDALPSLPEGGQ